MEQILKQVHLEEQDMVGWDRAEAANAPLRKKRKASKGY